MGTATEPAADPPSTTMSKQPIPRPDRRARELWGRIERPRTLALILGSALLSLGSFIGGATGAVPPETVGIVCGTLAIVFVLYFEYLGPVPGETPPEAIFTVLTLGLGALLVSTPAFFGGAFAREAVTLGNTLFLTYILAVWYYVAFFIIGDRPPLLVATLPERVLPDDRDQTPAENGDIGSEDAD